jgi:DNA-directed RNA polymerase specialized sigma subunit
MQMTAFDFYNQTRELDHSINIDLQELAIIRETAINDQYGGIGGGGDGNSSTPPKSKVEQAATRIVTAENAIKAKVMELERLKRIVTEKAEKLDDPVERVIIKWRYVLLKSWNDIIKVTGYSRTQVFRYHREALSKTNVE